MTKGPIVIVEDDKDDQEIYAEAIRSIDIPNEIYFFDSCQQALEYLNTTEEHHFIILSDINLTQMTGLQFRKLIQRHH